MPQDLIKVLETMQDGASLLQLNDKFTELSAACLSTLGKGKLTIELTLNPTAIRDGVAGQVETEMKVKMTKPEPAFGKGIFFVDPENGRLTRENVQAQRSLFGEGVRS